MGAQIAQLVPYSRKSVIKNKKTGYYFKIRILKLPPRHLYPQSTGTVKSTPLWGVRLKNTPITFTGEKSPKHLLSDFYFSGYYRLASVNWK
jgi:hypothetical protein